MRCIPRAKVLKNRPRQRTAGYRWLVCGNNFRILPPASHATEASSPTERLRGKQSLHYPSGKPLRGVLPRKKGHIAQPNGPYGVAKRPLLRRKAAQAASRWHPGRYATAAKPAKIQTKLRPRSILKDTEKGCPNHGAALLHLLTSLPFYLQSRFFKNSISMILSEKRPLTALSLLRLSSSCTAPKASLVVLSPSERMVNLFVLGAFLSGMWM